MSKSVLIVEDYEDSRMLLAYVLEQKGYSVLHAINGLEAVQIAKSERPDIILMDISLPVMNGITATQQIKSDDGTKHIPIIAITAHFYEYGKTAVDNGGFDEIIEKPIDFKLLNKVMARCQLD
jgi:two-component system, cell cycle response regulator DivK